MKRKRSGCSVIRVAMHPQHANDNVVAGKMQVFGGVVMSFMDTAAGSAARDICANRVVTKKFKEIDFVESVFVGDLLECYGEVTAIGNTSMTVKITVEVVRRGKNIKVTEGEALFVSVDENGKPIPVIGWNGKRPRIRRQANSPAASHQPSGGAGDSSSACRQPSSCAGKSRSVRRRRGSGCSVIRVEMHPQHANSNVVSGKMQVFGGVVMSFMDTAGASAARDICANRVVTKKFKEIDFVEPVFIGDLLECYAEVTAIGNTSMTVKITVEVVRRGKNIKVTEGEALFVSVDENVKPIPVIGWTGKRPRICRKANGSSACAQPLGGDGKSSSDTPTAK